jgi:probable phosphoglycerate mutase
MKIYAIRHGETIWNKERRLQGQMGSDLDEEGVLLAEMTAEALKDVHFDLCFSSPLIRARHTAEILLEGRETPIVEDERIMEISFGIWEGKGCGPTNMEIPEPVYRSFHKDPFGYEPPEGGETIEEVIARTGDFYRDITGREELQDKTILVATHGCAIRGILNNVYEDKKDFWHGGVPMNCAVSMVEIKDGVETLVLDDQVYYPEKYFKSFYVKK